MGCDEKAIEWGHPSYVWRQGQERRLNLVRQYVDLEGAHILDAGCGLGLYMLRFRDFTEHVYGVDVDPEKVYKAHETLSHVECAPAEQLPFEASFFDIVFSHEVLEHVDDDKKAVREAYRVLRPGGRLVIFVPNRWYPFETHGVYWQGQYHFGNIPLVNYLPTLWRDRLCPHVRAYTWRDIRRLLEGLPGRFVVHRCVFPGYDNVIARHRLLGTVLRRVSYFLERTPLQVLGLSHLVVFEKASN
ncbi:MAG: class I SAM-dependent methyltransferase [Chloroflexota bacterium]|nr:class I SAM-dependent methyltransferase [Chloroflexota bacterium]